VARDKRVAELITEDLPLGHPRAIAVFLYPDARADGWATASARKPGRGRPAIDAGIGGLGHCVEVLGYAIEPDILALESGRDEVTVIRGGR
jgi:hypothetical protein